MSVPDRRSIQQEGLTPEQYHRVHDLLDQAWMCPPRLRKVFLAGACGHDSVLLQEALALLAAREMVESDRPGLEIGALVGRYRVERQLGEGGMGIVYLVSPVAEARRGRFALKLIRSDVDDDAIVKRFALERRVLASLEHPNIARLIDAGETSDGLPYLVMEYVDGIPLNEYVDRLRYPIRDRLQLFQVVCSAVDHAHQRGVVHRDIKPSNILVTPSGIPKLVDFGIAKVARVGWPESTRLTRTNLAPGTPLYASPEQLKGQPIDARSDVYALGVVLFELLTGWWPFVPQQSVGGRSAARPSDVLKVRPKLLSVIASDPALTPAAIAAARRTTPTRLLRQLRGDLDAIVMSALREEADERYNSADELREDVQRYLDGLPIAARHQTLTYRAVKFGGRHPGGTLAAVLLVGLTLSGVAVGLRQPRSERVLPGSTAVEVSSPNHLPPQDRSLGPDVSRVPADRALGSREQTADPRSYQQSPRTTVRGRHIPGREAQAFTAQDRVSKGEAISPPPAHEQNIRALPGRQEDLSLGLPLALTSADVSMAADRDAILAILERFAEVYRTENTADFKQLYPMLGQEELAALDRDFVLGSYDVSITGIRIQVLGERAMAECELDMTITPIDGPQRTRSGLARFQFTRSEGEWFISSVGLPR